MKKFQIFEYKLTGGEKADITVDRTLDRGFTKLVGMYAYTDTNHENNVNLVVKSPLQVDDREVLPRNFDTHFLFPMLQNQEFTKFDEPIDVDNSKIEARLETIDDVSETCFLKIIFELEE